MIEVTMKFDTAAAVAAFFNVRKGENSALMAENSNITDEPNFPAAIAPEAVEAPKEKKTRTKKDTAPVDTAAELEAGDKQFTIDDVRNALSDHVGRTDFTQGTTLVRTFLKIDGAPATRLGEIQESDYAAFVAASKRVVA
jgi:hypothetical protein